jgi:hypothetical protein
MGQKEDGRGSNSACSDLFADSMEEALPLAGIYHAEAFLQLLGCAWSQFTGRIDR